MLTALLLFCVGPGLMHMHGKCVDVSYVFTGAVPHKPLVIVRAPDCPIAEEYDSLDPKFRGHSQMHLVVHIDTTGPNGNATCKSPILSGGAVMEKRKEGFAYYAQQLDRILEGQ